MKKAFSLALLILISAVSNSQGSLSLEIHQIHEGMVGDEDLTGHTTYRLYYVLEETGDIPIIFFGNDEHPMEINASEGFYQSIFGSLQGNQINHLFYEIIPALQYDSWITIGAEDQFVPGSNLLSLGSTNDNWTNEFEDGGNILIDHNVGGGWFDQWYLFGTLPVEEGNRVLIGQFTTTGNIWGNISVDYLPGGIPGNGASLTNYDLTFGSPDELIVGCTDPAAINYDETANVNDGCVYLEGDLNGDGEVNIIDVLDLLGNLGCAEDCGLSDINGDGVVNIWDLLEILGLLE